MESLGKYRLIRKLATGGMAEIFLARAPDADRDVVIKRILPEHAADERFVAMFLDEARVAARLHHPNIVEVVDVGEVKGIPFLAMERLEGRDVAAILATIRALPMDAALAIVTGVLAGLHHAHEQLDDEGRPLDIVHRDVSPENIFVTDEGAVKLFDFGIARAANRIAETQKGRIKGKMPYMSPEQCGGKKVDRRSDVFAAGVVLFELTTGHRPLPGKEDYTMVLRIIDEPYRKPSQLVPGYPPELERIVMRALEKDPAARYPTAAALRDDLVDFALERGLDIKRVRLPAAKRQARPSFAARLLPYQARLTAAALVLIAVWEVAVLMAARAGAPNDQDWRAAATAVAKEFRTGDLIVFAPRWIDPVGRRWLGTLQTIDDAARMDDARYARVWEVSIRDAEAGIAGTVAYERELGPIRVRRFERPAPKITWSMGQRPQLHEVGYEPHKCVLVAARSGQGPARSVFDDVELGNELAVAAGLADFRSRRDNTARAILRVLVDGQEVTRGVLGSETGWLHLPPATTAPGPHQVTFETSVDPTSDPSRINLQVCVSAEARRR